MVPSTSPAVPRRSPAVAARIASRPRLWPPSNGCATTSRRPAILSIFFHSYNHKFDERDWTYGEARAAMRSAGVPTVWMTQRRSKYWDGFAAAPGTMRSLARPMQRMLHIKAPRDLRAPESYDVTIDCEGDRGNPTRMALKLPAGVDARQVIRSRGGRETILVDETLRLEDFVWWHLRVDSRFVVRRAIDYMRDPRVIDAGPYSEPEGLVPAP